MERIEASYWGGYHHQSAEDVELSEADVVDVAAAQGALLHPLKQQVFVVVAEALKPGRIWRPSQKSRRTQTNGKSISLRKGHLT